MAGAKVELAARLQHFWSDNQVSCTADFDPDTEAEQLPEILKDYEGRLKAIMFLPSRRHGYQQPPYEQITSKEYEEIAASLQPLQGEIPHEEELEPCCCDGEEVINSPG